MIKTAQEHPDELLSPIDLLRRACDRNVPLQLHYRNPGTRSAVESGNLVCDTRMIALESDGLAVDWPQSIARTIRLAVGTEVDGYFSLSGQLFRMRTTVATLRHKTALNEEHELAGCLLVAPGQVGPGQRRQDHRVTVAGVDQIPVRIEAASKTEIGSCLFSSRPIKGKLGNLSRGGMRISVAGEERLRMHVGDWNFISFTAPGVEQEMIFLAEVRSINPIQNGQAVAAGMQFLCWPDTRNFNSQLQAIGKFVADIERNQRRNMAAKRAG